MPFSRLEPPLEYLHAASRASLQSFELTRLNHAANLRSEIGALIDQWLEETAEAMLEHPARNPITPTRPNRFVPTCPARVAPKIGLRGALDSLSVRVSLPA